MLFYLFIIFGATLLFHYSRRIDGWGRLLFYGFYIMLLALLEGLRDETIGIDIAVYGNLFFNNAKQVENLHSLIKDVKGEYAYHTLMWLCTRVSSDIHVMFFISGLLKISLISSTALFFQHKINATLFVFAYLCFFYFTGFNIMRQILAMAVFIYGLRFWYRKKHIKYLLSCIIAMQFHSSAVIALILYPISWIATKGVKTAIFVNTILVLLIYAGSMVIMEYIQSLDIGLYSEKALLYTEREGVTTAKTNILIAIVFLVIAVSYKFKKRMPDNRHFLVFISLIIWNIFFLLMSTYFEVSFRLSWYQVPVLIIMFLEYVRFYKKNTQQFFCFIFIIVFLLYFCVAAIHGLGGTIPYTSKILGF